MIREMWRSVMYPGSLQPRPQQGDPGVPATTVRNLETDGGDGIELLGPDEDKPEAPIQIVFFYGNGMTARDCEFEFDLFGAFGDVWVPEYVGYGRSTGYPSEAGCRASAEAAYHFLTHDRRIDPKRLMIVGFSLGAAVAIDLASRFPIGGLIALSPFVSLGAVASNLCFGAPVGRLLGRYLDNLTKMPAICCPILIASGTGDSLVPWEHGEQLAQANRRARFVPVPDAGHNDLVSCGDPSLIAALDELFETVSNHAEKQ
jgi:pimeloyl-ACP methyl ester carboxylesterase